MIFFNSTRHSLVFTRYFIYFTQICINTASVRGKADAAEHQECYMLACSLFLLFLLFTFLLSLHQFQPNDQDKALFLPAFSTQTLLLVSKIIMQGALCAFILDISQFWGKFTRSYSTVLSRLSQLCRRPMLWWSVSLN